MSRIENEQRVLGLFAASRERAIGLASRFVEDPHTAVEEATVIFQGR